MSGGTTDLYIGFACGKNKAAITFWQCFCHWPCSPKWEGGKRRGRERWEEMALRWRTVFHGRLMSVCQWLSLTPSLFKCWGRARERPVKKTMRALHCIFLSPPPLSSAVSLALCTLQMGLGCCSTSYDDMGPSCLLPQLLFTGLYPLPPPRNLILPSNVHICQASGNVLHIRRAGTEKNVFHFADDKWKSAKSCWLECFCIYSKI